MNCTIAIPQFDDGLLRKYMQSKYTASLRHAGVKVVWLKTDDLDQAIETMLQCDGLLMPGGEDMNPYYYGQAPSEKCGKIVPKRDYVEMKLLEAFFKTDRSILGICRGEQVLNVFLGGTLHQDIGHIARCCHRDWHHKNSGNHTVSVTPDTRLAHIMGDTAFIVNSLHHQAVDRIAPELIVSATCEDGIIEAIEHPQHRFCIGIQWHPEHMSAFSAQQRRIFDAFVESCKQ